MQGQETEERLTVKAAAKTLNVSTKTIHRYLSKGLLTKIKEGSRTLVSLQELTRLLGQVSHGQGQGQKGTQMGHSGDTVTLNRDRYEALLMEIGGLQKKSQLLEEFRCLMEKEDRGAARDRKVLEELAARVQSLEMKLLEGEKRYVEVLSRMKDLETEFARVKSQKPWWQK